MAQEQVRPSADDESEDSEPIHPTPERREDDLDKVLEDIDAVLEKNAKSFVAGYVQKGGQ